jgi:hypothetical protein
VTKTNSAQPERRIQLIGPRWLLPAKCTAPGPTMLAMVMSLQRQTCRPLAA